MAVSYPSISGDMDVIGKGSLKKIPLFSLNRHPMPKSAYTLEYSACITRGHEQLPPVITT